MNKEQLDGLISKLDNVDYGSRISVAKYNHTSDKLRNLIIQIAGSSHDELEELLSYLDEEPLGGWIAWTVLKECTLNDFQWEKCVQVIRRHAEGEGPESLAAQWWLRDNVNNS